MSTSTILETLVKNPLKEHATKADGTPVTSDLQPPANLTSEPRWGRALIGQTTCIDCQIEGFAKQLEIPVEEHVILGRGANSHSEFPHISLDDYDAHQQGVSRRHAEIVIEDGTLKIVDLDSTNGTYLNGHRLWPRQPRILRDGDRLHLGNLVLTVSFG